LLLLLEAVKTEFAPLHTAVGLAEAFTAGNAFIVAVTAVLVAERHPVAVALDSA
jgi:hypothetical protein